MNEKKFCFISCVNNKKYYHECLYYINSLNIPEGYEIEIFSVQDVKSMAEAYNQAMKESDAKYKIYLHQDTFIINENILYDILYTFENNKNIGMIGSVGAGDISKSLNWWESEEKYGNIYEASSGILKELKLNEANSRFEKVKIIDGFIMITQYDIPWRDDILNGYSFCNVSQSLEFIKNGYEVVVHHQDEPWVIHDGSFFDEDEYKNNISKMISEYSSTIEDINNKETSLVVHEKKLNSSITDKYYYNSKRKVFVAKDYKYLQYLDGSEKYIYDVFKTQKKISAYPTELSRFIYDWGSEYHLTHIRTNLLHSIEGVMKKTNKALELGAGMGASTNWLAEKFDNVHCIEGNIVRAKALKERNKNNSNVNVFVDDLNKTEFPEDNYDLITLLGVMEYLPFYSDDKPENVCKNIMKKACNNLSDDGIFVLAIENKLGAKYFAGCPEDHNGKLFTGINGYPEKSPVTFSKKELNDMLNESGFNNVQFYFPFPDYKLPTTIIRECNDVSNFEVGAIVRGNSRSYTGKREYLMMEPLMLDSLNKAGILFDMCNSFLVICSKNKELNLNTDYIIRKYWNSLFSNEKLHHYADFVKNNNEYMVNKHYIKEGINKRQKDSDILKINLKNSKIVKGKNVLLDVYKSLLINDNYETFYKYVEKLKKELIENFWTGKTDSDGYKIVNGNAFDFVFNNLIEDEDEKWVFIDKKWKAEMEFAEDYIIYRAINNIFCQMHNFINIYDCSEFIMKFMTRIYNGYDESRLIKSYKIEEECLKSIFGSYKVSNFKDNIFSKSLNIKDIAFNNLINNKKKLNNKKTLYTPTQICKYDDMYFIADCWHNRILYTSRWTDDLEKWNIAVEGLSHPHSMAYDGDVFLTEDTERNRLVSFRINKDKNYKVEDINIINCEELKNGRPHYVCYMEETDCFMVWLSNRQTVLFLKRNNNKFNVIFSQRLIKENIYIRSCKWIDGRLYVVSGKDNIVKFKYDGKKFIQSNKYRVSNEIAGMNDIEKIGHYYYITVYTDGTGKIKPKIIRTQKLENLESHYEDLSYKLNIKGVPYYITKFNGKVYIPEIDTYSRIAQYRNVNGELLLENELFDYGITDKNDINNKNDY